MKNVGGSSRKKAEAQQLQIEIDNDDDWRAILQRSGLLVVDVYSEWCGACSSMTGLLRRVKMEVGDDCLTLAKAEADKIEELRKFRGKAEPTWLFFGGGKPLCSVHGADGPRVSSTLKELLKEEREIAKGNPITRRTVLLESLVKPEEVIDLDEDLDDLEADRDEVDEEAAKAALRSAILLISPRIVAADHTEEFLSVIVSAGISIAGHIQKELAKEEFLKILRPQPLQENNQSQDKDAEKPKDPEQSEKEEVDATTAFWEEELTKGPLYMLLLKVDEGSIFELWETLLGPHDLEQASKQYPDSLVAQFGTEELPVPAWLPLNQNLQSTLQQKFFPPPPDEALPRILILPDSDHKQILENLCQHGVQVMAHTQAVLTDEILADLSTSASSEQLPEYIGAPLLVAVVTGKNVVSAASEFGALHLTTDAENSLTEVTLFFPDLTADLTCGSFPHDEPQTQMQIEQKKETERK